jgi:glycosyltransferase involved in cell wall biosynthesis
MIRLGILQSHTFVLTAFFALIRNRFDVVHCCSFLDAFAARLARTLTGVPYIFWANGVPPPVKYIRQVSAGGRIFSRAVRDADELVVLSRYMQGYFQRRFQRAGRIIPAPVDLESFTLSEDRELSRQVILCVAALDDERKGGRFLIHAFDRLKKIRPEVVLEIGGVVSPQKRKELSKLVAPSWRKDVRFLDLSSTDELSEAYGRASITVLPSLWEGFGVSVLESLATGTPVVGTDDGAIPELISSPDVGRLFPPGETTVEPTNLEGFVQAMSEALDLIRKPETPKRCRKHAEAFSWDRIGPEFHALYREVTEGYSRVSVELP